MFKKRHFKVALAVVAQKARVKCQKCLFPLNFLGGQGSRQSLLAENICFLVLNALLAPYQVTRGVLQFLPSKMLLGYVSFHRLSADAQREVLLYL